MPDDEKLVRIDDVCYPVEGPQIGLERRREMKSLISGQALTDDLEHRAVPRGDLRQVIGRNDAAATRHVADDKPRMTGDVPAHETGEQPRQLVVVAARSGPD